MIMQVPNHARIFIGVEPLDFRNGFNGTAAACRQRIEKNPLNGGLFAFINRTRTMIRLYFFDGHGEYLMTKRVARGRFFWWKEGEVPAEVIAEHLYLLLRGGDPKKVRLPEPWKKLT